MTERRCPACAALVGAAAAWCGQCYADLRPRAPGGHPPTVAASPAPAGRSGAGRDAPAGRSGAPAWQCRCGTRHGYDRLACPACGHELLADGPSLPARLRPRDTRARVVLAAGGMAVVGLLALLMLTVLGTLL